MSQVAQPSSWHLHVCPVSEKHEVTSEAFLLLSGLDATLIWQGCPQNSICWSLQYLYTCRLGLGKRQVASQSKSVFRPGLHVFLDVYFLMRFDMLCFYQSMSPWESHCNQGWPPQKKGQFHPCILQDCKLVTG